MMNRRSILLFTLLFILAADAHATRKPWADGLEYPVSRLFLAEPAYITSTLIHHGEDYVIGPLQDLYPMDSGNIVLFRDNEGALSNFITIVYGDYASVYYHIADGSVVKNIPSLAGKQNDAIEYYVTSNKIVAESGLAHLHVQIYDTNSATNNYDLVSPRYKFPSVFAQTLSSIELDPLPEIDVLCARTQMPVGALTEVRFKAHDSDYGGPQHGIYKWQLYSNGFLEDEVCLNEYRDMSDIYVVGPFGSCGDESYHIESHYTVYVLDNNHILLNLIDYYGRIYPHRWVVVDIEDITSFNVSVNTGQVKLEWNVIQGYSVEYVNIYRSDYSLGPYNKINSTPIEITKVS